MLKKNTILFINEQFSQQEEKRLSGLEWEWDRGLSERHLVINRFVYIWPDAAFFVRQATWPCAGPLFIIVNIGLLHYMIGLKPLPQNNLTIFVRVIIIVCYYYHHWRIFAYVIINFFGLVVGTCKRPNASCLKESPRNV